MYDEVAAMDSMISETNRVILGNARKAINIIIPCWDLNLRLVDWPGEVILVHEP
jgi:hypothetical protein